MKLKELFKSKKRTVVLSIVSVLLIAGIITAVILIPKKNNDEPIETENVTETETEVETIVADIPEDTETAEIVDITEVDPENIITPEETTAESETTSVKETEKAKETAKAETVKSAETTSSSGSVIIGGGETTQKTTYSCGVAGHHCQNEAAHAHICNLEIEGCPYCGSHSCKSFYATDEWGQSQYTPSLCPKYNIKNDPTEYCQDCGKKLGDGTNGTCVQYVNACYCTSCGKWVESFTCHSCN